ELAAQVLRSVIRILGTSRRYQGNDARRETDNTPRNVQSYLKAVAAGRCDEGDLIEAVAGSLTSTIAPKWDLRIKGVDSPLKIVETIDRRRWICPRCNRSHLHPSADVCSSTGCNTRGLIEVEAADDPEHGDFYSWLAGMPPRRLRVRELTGQTKPLSVQ